MLEHLIQNVAEARLALDTASANHARHMDEVSRLRARFDDCKTRQDAITRKRLAGESTPAEASEYVALNGDLGVLSELLAEAHTRAAASDPAQARAALARAESDLRGGQEQAEFDAVIQHAREAEQVYIACLRSVWEAAQQRGRTRTFGETFAIAEPIVNLCRHNNFAGLRVRP
jgi:chromosome segregation ATPase